MNNALKIAGVVVLTVASLAVAYHYLFKLPKEEALYSCQRSYGSEWEHVIKTELRATTADFCEKGYDFIRFMVLSRKSKDAVRERYTEPDDPTFEQEIKEATYLLMRQKIGLGY